MEQEIQKILDERVNPILAEHLGGAKLVSFENNIAKIRLTGMCASCPTAQFTTEEVVKEILMTNCKGVNDVFLDMSVSDELFDMAKKIMNKGN